MAAVIEQLSPMLAVQDVSESAAYYRDRLGFEVLMIAENPGLPTYGVVARDGFQIHLLEESDRQSTLVFAGISVSVSDVDEIYREFLAAGAFAAGFPRHLDTIREHPPEDKEYGRRDMIFVEPDGHILVFGQDLPIT